MDDRDNIIILRDEDGMEIEFEYLDTVFFYDREFIVILPLEEIEDDEGEVVILEIKNLGDEEEFVPVENEEELLAIFEKFKKQLADEFDFDDDDDNDDDEDYEEYEKED